MAVEKKSIANVFMGKEGLSVRAGNKKKPSFVDINYQVTVNQLQRRRNDLLSDV